MHVRMLIAAGLVLCSLAVWSGCGARSAPKTSATSAAAAPRTLTKITVSYVGLVANFLPAWYAKDKGFFEKNGLDVEFVSITGSAGLPALLSGQTQIAFIGGTEVLDGALGGADPVAFLNITQKQLYVLEVAPEIKTIDDLKGKKVAVSSFGSTSDTATRAALRLKGLDPNKDVTLVASGSIPNRTAALIGGAVQADLTSPPDSFDLEAKGYHPLIDLSDLPLAPPVTTFAAKKTYIDAHRDVVQKFTDAIVQAVAQEQKDKEFAVGILKKYLKSNDDAVMTKTWEFSVKTMPGPPAIAPEQFASVVDEVSQKNPKAKGFDVTKVADQSFVKSAVDRGLAK